MDSAPAPRVRVSLSTFDRALVIVGSALCAVGVGYGMRSSAAAAEKTAPAFLGGGAGPVARGGPGPKPPDPAAKSDEIEWSVINGYEYVEGLKNLPAAVRALDGKTVVLRGFLTPLYEFDDIHEFILVANHMSCCFGVPAGLSGQVQVKVAGERGLPNTSEPIEVRGTFRAVETMEQGYILSIYRIDDAKVRIVGYK